MLAYEVDYTNIPYPHCVSINNDYIYDHDAYYSSSDIVATLTHELGHYLGLRHAFSEMTRIRREVQIGALTVTSVKILRHIIRQSMMTTS